MTKIKICGITNIKDADKAVSLGADAIGFVFAESPRKTTPKKVKSIISDLKGSVLKVGVFVNESAEVVNRISDECSLDAVQLHGDESVDYCSQITKPIIKAFRIKNEESLKPIPLYRSVFAYLLDTYSDNKYGGTGLTFDWNIVGHINKRIFLAGGINPDNAAAAIELGVYGIDVCSGIESEPGKKDHKKMKKLFRNIRHLRG